MISELEESIRLAPTKASLDWIGAPRDYTSNASANLRPSPSRVDCLKPVSVRR